MHQQCQYDFEETVDYDTGGESVAHKLYCYSHHPHNNNKASSDHDSDSTPNVDDAKQAAKPSDSDSHPNVDDGKQAAKQSDHHSPVDVDDAKQAANKPDSASTLDVDGAEKGANQPDTTQYQCDWSFASTGCQMAALAPIPCQHEGCKNLVHHVCQNVWQDSPDGTEPDTIATLCRFHHPTYFAPDLQVLPDEEGMDGDAAIASIIDDVIEEMGDQLEDVTNDTNVESDDEDSTDSEEYTGDSDDDGSEAEIHDSGTVFESDEPTIDDLYGVELIPGQDDGGILGAPEGWIPPGPPDGWSYQPKNGAPSEDEVDNPGNWNLFSFAPRHAQSTKRYEGHFTPANAKVVQPDSSGNRKVKDWTFYYRGWTAGDFEKSTFARGNAERANLKPSDRKGSLDADVLRKHGLSADRMQHDPLFFYQLLFPFCDPTKSEIENDNRMPYFTLASICTNVYAAAQGGGSGIGHDWRSVNVAELVHWTGVPIRNGALDGKPATLNARWNAKDARYDQCIDDSISKSRWKQLKRYFKLNNNLQDKRKGEIGYDPCTKYDLVYKALIHNMNYVTKTADLDGTIDESTWGFGGYMADCGGRLINKPVSRGK